MKFVFFNRVKGAETLLKYEKETQDKTYEKWRATSLRH